MLRASLRALAASSALALLAPLASAQISVIDGTAMPQAMELSDALDVGQFSVQSLDMPEVTGPSVEVDVVIDGVTRTLALQPWSVRSAEHFQVLAQIEDGSYVEVDVGPSPVWRGTVVGVPGSRVSADLSDGQLDALVRLTDDEPIWAVQPLTDALEGADKGDHVVYSEEDTISRGESCGGSIVVGDERPEPAQADDGSGFSGLSDDVVCEIACDTDVQYYQDKGSSVAQTEAAIEQIIDRVQNIYQPQLSIAYEITTIIVRTSEPDPYSSSNASTLLGQFQNHWNSQQTGVQRDIAHLFTGRNLQGGTIGIAFLNTICSQFSGYGLSENFTGNLISLTGLTAHELGHNWSAQHCNGTNNCWIMCASLGGCNSNLTNFGPVSINSITNKKNSSNCLDPLVPPPPPVITSLSPTTVGPLGGSVTVTGTGLSSATGATVGGQTTSVIPTSDTSAIVSVPAATSLGNVSLSVFNDQGSSNNLTVTYVVSQPPVSSAPGVINTITDTTATWSVATDPADTVYFLFDLDTGNFNYKGFTVLDTPLPILTIPTNAAGVGSLVAPIDPSLGGVGAYSLYSQFVFFKPTIYDTSNVLITIVF